MAPVTRSRRKIASNLPAALQVDWSAPRFRKWRLPKHLNPAQRDALFDFDERMPPFTEAEQIDACQRMQCGVLVALGNLCHKAETKWPRTMFGKRTLAELSAAEKGTLYGRLQVHGPKLYDDCVDVASVKRRCKRIRDATLAPLMQEREAKYRYYAVMDAAERTDSDVSGIHKIVFSDDGTDDEAFAKFCDEFTAITSTPSINEHFITCS